MAGPVELGKAAELIDGAIREVVAGGKRLLLARVGDSYYTAESRCPHLGADLIRGTLQGTVITCPWHGSQFDLTDGHVVRWTKWTSLVSRLNKALRSPRPLKVYHTSVKDGKILAEL